MIRSKLQFEFRQSHSTTEQVHRVYHTVRRCFVRKQYCSASFLDMQQAFDMVWHKGILCKFKQTHPHRLFLIIALYLSDRYFRVQMNDSRSSLKPIEVGVPQGSVLDSVLSCPVVATYADDIAYLVTDIVPAVTSAKLQCLLNQNLTTSPSHLEKKTVLLYVLDTLSHSDCVKYLGFHLDRRLTWKQQIKKKRD